MSNLYSYETEIRSAMLNWFRTEISLGHRIRLKTIELANALMDSNVWKASEENDAQAVCHLTTDPTVREILNDTDFQYYCEDYTEWDIYNNSTELDGQIRWWIADKVSDQLAKEITEAINKVA